MNCELRKKIAILGSTGSIGTQALDIIAANPERYEAYVLTANRKADLLIEQARRMEETRLPDDVPYEQIEHLRLEARQKLAKQKPVSLGAAGRIPGVNPADVAVLTVWLERRKQETENK